MGKIRIKALGIEEQEEKQKKRDEKRRASKRAKKENLKVKAPGKSKGGERIVSVGPSEEELERAEIELKKKSYEKAPKSEKVLKPSEKKAEGKPPKTRSKRYKLLKTYVDRAKTYTLKDALGLVLKTANTSFTGSVEAHINMRKTAKELNLKSPGNKKTIPAKHAKPNQQSKPATKSKPAKNQAKSANFAFSISFEKKQPVAHATLGKTSAKEPELVKQYKEVLKYIGKGNIRKITLSSTMGPGIKVEVL